MLIVNRRCKMFHAAILCVILYWKLFAVEPFNIAPKPTIIIHEPLDYQFNINTNEKHSSYFGYTIVLREGSIIIGAPRARTVRAYQESRETGAIYQYNLESNKIEKISFENAITFKSFDKLLRNTTEQWLGGAMDGGGTDADPLIVCAPQLKVMTLGCQRTQHVQGVCYWTNNTLDNESQKRMLNPFPVQGRGKKNKIECSDFLMADVGFSLHITSNNGEIISGAPGRAIFEGATLHYDMLSRSPEAFNADYYRFMYKGYAVGSGYFEQKNGRKLYYVATAPKANRLYGQATIYTKESGVSKQVYKLSGEQYGEFFGYALLVEDVNGDGLDDILIGAPYRTVNAYFEAGAVYVYINQAVKNKLNFKKSIIESPFPNRGRFGTTLTKLGDVNGDGYKDVAIGAPFADGVGVVALFFGGPDGLDAQPRQLLNAGDQFAGGMFGHGLSKGVDIDANGFNDLAIGAPNADTVFVYRAYPVVKINATIRPMESLIPIDAMELQYEICFNILTNATKIRQQELLLELSTDPEEKRINVTDFKNNRLYFASRQPNCLKYKPLLTFDVSSEFKSIVLELKYRLKNDAKMWSDSEFCSECAIVDPIWPSVSKASVQYLHNMVDLQLQSLDVRSNLTLGITKSLPVKYNIVNAGEEAYNTLLTVQSSLIVPFAKLPAECAEMEMGRKVECSLAKRRGFTGSTELELSFDLSVVAGATEMNITASISSAGNETTPEDNVVYNTVKLITTAEIWIIETSTNEIIAITSEKGNVTVSTTFEIQNIGPSPLNHLNLIIEFPIGYDADKVAKQTYVSNITAQVHIKDYVNTPLDFETSAPITPSILNVTEILNLNHLSETRTSFLSCQSGEKNDMKKLCALSVLELSCGLQSGQNITLELSYEIQTAIIEKLMVNKADHLVHIVSVNLNLKPVATLNEALSIKRHLKGTVFVKLTKRKTLWIYLAAIVGGLLLLAGAIWLLERFGFFKRLTKEEMEQNFIEKQEKARMREDLDECVAEMEEDLAEF